MAIMPNFKGDKVDLEEAQDFIKYALRRNEEEKEQVPIEEYLYMKEALESALTPLSKGTIPSKERLD